ncbi:MAG TPA: formimidoylglutamate deiminase [Streptosporangiaceae bacterium]|nr:formimidoylglutamate deiminase [Streptosporangiaceae bacterium]
MTGPAMTGPPATGPARPARQWLAELAWLPVHGVRPDVLIEASGDRFTAVTPGVAPDDAAGATRLPGLTLPGLANAHSHAFHRALRGITQAGRGTFWTWREQMYQLAARLEPASYLALARAVYAEMALAGITCAGEFHYLHHAPGGIAYADPNELGKTLIAAAGEAGIRITLLDTCYLSGGLDPGGSPVPLAGPQLRFGDGDGEQWAARASALGADSHGVLSPLARAGAAIHSVRAVPPDQLHPVIAWAQHYGAPLHAHLSEQTAENLASLAAYQATPAEVLYDAGALGPRATVVHATHLASRDIELLGGSRTFACFCPTTEADLADGIGPARALASAGCGLSLGTDSQAVIDLFEEARRMELGERLATHRRGHFTAAELATAATVDGHACLGWPDAGEIVPGALADLVTVALDSLRLAGTGPATALESVIFAAAAADVRSVVVCGRDVVRDGRHLLIEDVPAALSAAIRAVLD